MYKTSCKSHVSFSLFLMLAHKSRSSRRSKAAEPHELPVASSYQCHVTTDTCSDTGAPQTTRLKEILSPARYNQPPSLKPRPPSKVWEQPSTVTYSPSASISMTNQTDTITKECSPVKNRDPDILVQTASGKADAHTSSQKHRNHKKHTSEKAATKDQTHTPSLRSCSSLDHKSPSSKTRSATHVPVSVSTLMHREHNKEGWIMRNQAARIIQRAWRR